MPHITDLPPEIHSRIFSFVELGTQQYRQRYQPNFFPHNLAHVCVLWLNILMTVPRYWSVLLFDLAEDPTPFLDTIGLFGKCGITIEIVNHDNTPLNIDHEKSRLSRIYARMASHLAIFTKIDIFTDYQSSLPSCADLLTHHLPHLSKFRMKCHNYNFDDIRPVLRIKNTSIIDRKNCNVPVFPSLILLDIPGYSFMELLKLGPQWLSKFKCCVDGMELRITHFKFENDGPLWNPYTSKSFDVFLDGFVDFTGDKRVKGLFLTELSIDYRPLTRSEKCYIDADHLTFEDVSRDFLSSFFDAITFRDGHVLTTIKFDGCAIPTIHPDARLAVDTLNINYIPTLPKLTSCRKKDVEVIDYSFYNAVTAFPPTNLVLTKSDDISDQFFHWLSGDGVRVEANLMTTLKIEDCLTFTSNAVRNFIMRRNRRSRFATADSPVLAVTKLEVIEGPHLSKADALWFDKPAQSYIDFFWSRPLDATSSSEDSTDSDSD